MFELVSVLSCGERGEPSEVGAGGVLLSLGQKVLFFFFKRRETFKVLSSGKNVN